MGSLDSPVTGVYSFSYSHEQVFWIFMLSYFLKNFISNNPYPLLIVNNRFFFKSENTFSKINMNSTAFVWWPDFGILLVFGKQPRNSVDKYRKLTLLN